MSIQIFALTDPHEKVIQARVREIQAPVHYLEEAVWPRSLREVAEESTYVARRHLQGYLSALWYVITRKSIDRGYVATNRWNCFLQAVFLVRLLDLIESRAGKKIDRLHAHFAHDPALIAYLVHRMTGMPFSFTAHARDLYQVPEQALTDRIAEAEAVVTCCGANLEYLNRIAPRYKSKFSLIYHGVNLKDFQPAAGSEASDGVGTPLILSVGRLVEKKGFQDLLQSLLIVKGRGGRFHCDIYGDGPLCQQLAQWIEEHGMTGDILLHGERTQQELIPLLQKAAFFALTPVEVGTGDRDGIPNVLVEAMAVGLPVITTAVAGIAELVEDQQDGLLYQPHDVQGISSGIMELLSDERLRRRLGSAASKKVAERFDIDHAARRLKVLFA